MLQQQPYEKHILTPQLVTSEKHQKALLGGIERLVGNASNSDELCASGATAKILMGLYQKDILEEDVCIQWGTHVSKKYVDKDVSKRVRKSAEQFIKWLEEADDESDDE
jgi:translation initiation factor 5